MKRKEFRYTSTPSSEPEALREMSAASLAPMHINVRAAKDRLSSLLEEAARGHEIIITSDGQPRAKLIPVQPTRKRFKVDWELLRSAPLKAGPTAAELIRQERDGRP